MVMNTWYERKSTGKSFQVFMLAVRFICRSWYKMMYISSRHLVYKLLPSPLQLTDNYGNEIDFIGLCCLILVCILASDFNCRRILIEVIKNVIIARFVAL